jgi:hypothetical protein
MKQKENILCPHCGNEINIGSLLGSRTSEKKLPVLPKMGKRAEDLKFQQ